MVQHVIEALAGRVRRALPSPSIASGAAVIALGLAAQATLGALGPPTLALAADQVRDHRDAEPAARLEVVVESFYIFDDRDWGEGDLMQFQPRAWGMQTAGWHETSDTTPGDSP
jgi:hypothetical protein